jgi:7,8-dihydropterin-6-yl-methyl-4-(beta-D-ribofuranosyl)aminobenzene 5'-phosphate synthase
MAHIRLRPADRVEITILADNTSDLLLADSVNVRRLRVQPPAAPLAEHGLACLISAWSGDEKHTVLMDAGISGICMLHNAALLASSMSASNDAVTNQIEDVESIVLSHGHFDHFHGMHPFLKSAKRKLPLVVHPQAFGERRSRPNAQHTMLLPSLDKHALEAAGAVVEEREQPSTLAEGLILVTGEVKRETAFEKGSPGLEAKVGEEWIQDPFLDDQGIAVDLRGRGLVVLSGCSHSGIINTVLHARNITGVQRIHAVMGGFHLGGRSEAMIEPTVEAMLSLSPDIVVPMHCTGWKAIHRFAEAMPEAFVFNSVGTTYLFAE